LTTTDFKTSLDVLAFPRFVEHLGVNLNTSVFRYRRFFEQLLTGKQIMKTSRCLLLGLLMLSAAVIVLSAPASAQLPQAPNAEAMETAALGLATHRLEQLIAQRRETLDGNQPLAVQA
jgi:hypothetical protein